MSTLANPPSEQNEVKSSLSIPHCCWGTRGGATIRVAVPIAEHIKRQVLDAFRALPRRGLEVGGVLLGRVAQREPLEVFIHAFQPLPCEHRFGPSFILSDGDRAQLEQILEQSKSQPECSVVGYYRSITGREIGLDAADQELIQQHFSDPEQVILAIKPVSLSQCVAWCFARQEGHLPAKPAGSPFPFADGRSAIHWKEFEPSPEAAPEPAPEPAGSAHLPGAAPASPAPPATLPAISPPGDSQPERAALDGRSAIHWQGLEPTAEAAPEPAPEPVPAPPAALPALSPQGVSKPQRAAPRRVLPWALAALAGLAAFAVFHPRGDTSAPPQWSRLGLAAQRTASGIEVTWDRSVLVLGEKPTGGLLAINDGNSEIHIELDAAAFARGRLTCQPSGSDLLFRLSIFGSGGHSTTESFHMVGAASSPSPAIDRPEAAAAARESPDIPLQPDQPPEARPETPPAMMQPLAPGAAPAVAIAAVAVHEVRPGISEAIQARLRTPVTVPVHVQIDAAGKVTGAAVQGGGDGLYRYLAERAKHAARFWRFRPARGKDGQLVPSTKTLFFVFRN